MKFTRDCSWLVAEVLATVATRVGQLPPMEERVRFIEPESEGAGYDGCMHGNESSNEACRWRCFEDAHVLMASTTRHYPNVFPCRSDFGDALITSSTHGCVGVGQCTLAIEMLFADYLAGAVVVKAQHDTKTLNLKTNHRRKECSAQTLMVPFRVELKVLHTAIVSIDLRVDGATSAQHKHVQTEWGALEISCSSERERATDPAPGFMAGREVDVPIEVSQGIVQPAKD